MNFKLTEEFEENLNEILLFIARGSVANALKFRDELFEKIADIEIFPYGYRKNQVLQNEKIRDLIFFNSTYPLKIASVKL